MDRHSRFASHVIEPDRRIVERVSAEIPGAPIAACGELSRIHRLSPGTTEQVNRRGCGVACGANLPAALVAVAVYASACRVASDPIREPDRARDSGLALVPREIGRVADIVIAGAGREICGRDRRPVGGRDPIARQVAFGGRQSMPPALRKPRGVLRDCGDADLRLVSSLADAGGPFS